MCVINYWYKYFSWLSLLMMFASRSSSRSSGDAGGSSGSDNVSSKHKYMRVDYCLTNVCNINY